ncbi:hypothetical protein SADUNF_Sadunf01G0021200 [Salix dunnii]|uniref:Brix domain-containing protein n=1 Tax=Salix dunnii TaxID=1413687 RepID=A0A835TKV8_9ROSI|nr:hypothetical protein SADUNF_Sadunf01G0021200 [Salix dunnii]
MFRRKIRSRREYLYRKILEGKERLLYEKKRGIREARGNRSLLSLETKKPHFVKKLILRMKALQYAIYDDEYAKATKRDPKILLTTSRDPSAPLTKFVKFVFPNVEPMNRGGQVNKSEIIESCRAHDYTDVILVHNHRGVPDGLVICHLPFGPTAYFEVLNVDKKAIGTMPDARPHLILSNFKSKILKRIITFANQYDHISFRHHIYEKHGGPKSVELKEIGPRFEMRLYQIKLGTVDQTEAQYERVLRPYMNTTNKRKFIGD